MISIYEKKCKLCSLNIWNIALILFVLLFTSCKDDDTDPGREGWIRVLPLEYSRKWRKSGSLSGSNRRC